MNKVIKKFFRSLMYIVGIGAMTLVDRESVGYGKGGELGGRRVIHKRNPSLLIILAAGGLQLGEVQPT